ncbi:MAG: hypothetical protein K9W43_05350 [Candidatus Thorarchaeota archaeon]|nr:hypothetical protein [Candidatus Thorarchaeota archaeon]
MYKCALCGRERCQRHTVWVPAHEFEAHDAKTEQARSFLRGEPIGGWIPFCGDLLHTPRGVTIRLGEDRTNGNIVASVPFSERHPGYKMFRMWEVGVVENGIEYRWPQERYRVSCSLAGLMTIAVMFYHSDLEAPVSTAKIYSQIISSSKVNPNIFRRPSREEFFKQFGTEMLLADLLEYICSRCMVAVCLNRQAEFFDKKLFNTILRHPWKLSP